jgi:hypothetical protein
MVAGRQIVVAPDTIRRAGRLSYTLELSILETTPAEHRELRQSADLHLHAETEDKFSQTPGNARNVELGSMFLAPCVIAGILPV